MEYHPSVAPHREEHSALVQHNPEHPRLAELISKYPKSAGALFQTFNDVTLAQKWTDVEVLELAKCGRGAIKGIRPSFSASEPASTCVVVPCGLAESLSTSWIRDAFDALDNQFMNAPEVFFLAICSEDSSIVYYKIGKGIMKPQV